MLRAEEPVGHGLCAFVVLNTWICNHPVIDILQENAYNVTVTMENKARTVQQVFTGSYIEDEEGKIESFTVVFPD